MIINDDNITMILMLILCCLGHYMYIETSNAPPNTEAKMYSPWYYNYGQSCVQFFYHMFGAQIGELNILIRYAQGLNVYKMFSKAGNQNDTWRLGQASVLNVGYFQACFKE